MSAASVKKTSVLDDLHINSYYRDLNDSVRHYHVITRSPSAVERVVFAGWRIKYKKMTSEKILSYLEYNGLSLVGPLNEEEDLFDEKNRMFWNRHISQYLRGSFDKSDNYFYVAYDYPTTYYDAYEGMRSSNELREPRPRNRFKKDLKDYMIGAPH